MRLLRFGILAALMALACTTESAEQTDTQRARADNVTVSVDSTALLEAADRVIAFLRGQAPFAPGLFADTVMLYVAPEGGGASVRVQRDLLADLANWRAGDYRLTPPKISTQLTKRVGRHLNCHEVALSTRYVELERFPHVGTKLEPAGADSCLQSWNLTLVFTHDRPPAVVAVVYDQWEW